MSSNFFRPRRGGLGGPPQAFQQSASGGYGGGGMAIPEEIRMQVIDLVNQAQGAQSSKLIEIEQQLNFLFQQMEQGMVQFPDQFRQGVIKYPDRYPFNMTLSQTLRTQDQQGFGRTNDIAYCQINIDVDNPTVLTRISFDLHKPDIEGNTGIIGAYLPLSAKLWNGLLQVADGSGAYPANSFIYQGRDFRWRVQGAADNMQWQTGWRSSAMLDDLYHGGFTLPTEHEFKRNDVIAIEAQPIAPPSDPVQEWELVVHLHTYKMLLKDEARV